MRKRKTVRKKVLIILCLILLILYCTQMVKTFSRYVYKHIQEFYLKSNNFYFNSDKLQEEMITYNVENWSGVEDYTININMNSMENNNVFSNSNIEYDISYSCSDNVLCQ